MKARNCRPACLDTRAPPQAGLLCFTPSPSPRLPHFAPAGKMVSPAILRSSQPPLYNCMRPWHYHYSPEAAAVLPRYRCWALIGGVLREYTQASIVPLSGAGVYLGTGLHVRSAFEPAPPPASLLP